MENDVTVILLIVSIFNIILFFKLWKMCNNVKKLTKTLCENEQDISSLVPYLVMTGQIDEAEQAITKSLCMKFIEAFPVICSQYNDSAQSKMIQNIIDKYDKSYQKIGREMPAQYKELTFEKLKEFMLIV